MPSFGPLELAILVILLAVVLVVVVGVVKGARQAGGGTPVMPPSPEDLERLVTQLTHRGRKIEAIKELRTHVGLGLKEAKDVVDAVAVGHPLWSHPNMARFRPGALLSPQDAPRSPQDAPRADLATRVRELKATGRAEQAVYLVRGETGMGQAEAEAFVGTL
ncbi:ribosomal protein L7/L12 [Sphaerisporangium sp. TRM90804]|uniref:ribosomal protein L7/L12 n=1 Tax=Sphaerisporangium sp. TRM90804 TaxID=3031113 RepID=UPI00244CF2D9|nr:ribosomal protein L7/L12 [Sphaerisporangium sp. TRM90804]MDH2426633.1 ribosomal protein L7/L12 [Sphaerisporangium sp. TRM90804]